MISVRENISKVFIEYRNNEFKTLILPVRGYGLWGTLYGYLALDSDLNTIVGLEFYKHKETPGLGAEVDNPNWKNLWNGKKVYDENGLVQIEVIKGALCGSTVGAPGGHGPLWVRGSSKITACL